MSTVHSLVDFKGKNVLVTGATGQLGKEICGAFLDAGAHVIGTDKEIAKKNKLASKKIQYHVLDVTDGPAVQKLFKKVYQKSPLDILINNAGVSTFAPFQERKEKDFDWVMDVNLKGTFFCIQTLAGLAREYQHSGSIVNIASHYGLVSPDPRIYTDTPRHNSEVYGATKAGIIQMTKYFAVHLAKDKVRVNSVSPGGIFNPVTPQGEDFIKNYSFRCPMARMGEAKEMVGGILYLSSNAASYTTGHNLVIDGGFSSW